MYRVSFLGVSPGIYVPEIIHRSRDIREPPASAGGAPLKLSTIGEFGLIEKIRRTASSTGPSVILGIGDDAAAVRTDRSNVLLVTTDMLLEGVHFDLSYTDMASLGWKAAAVNISDIAAMGGVPRYALVSLGIPRSISVEKVQEFYRGFNKILRAFHLDLLGGDTNRSLTGLTVNVVVLGECEQERTISRSGAKPGDLIFVSGTLGDSAAGLKLLRSRRKRWASGEKKLIQKHLRPVPRVLLARKLGLSGCVTSMIDLSDGMASDLGHICDQSSVGAVVHAEQVPLSRELKTAARKRGLSSFDLAMSGGEDYELLFTVSPGKAKKLRPMASHITQIGEMTRGKGRYLIDRDGKKKRFAASGYEHFT